MKTSMRMLAAAVLASAAADAVEVPVPVEGATLTLNVHLQPWFQVQEDLPAPNVGEQFYLRRVRLLAYGRFSKEFRYLFTIDSPNFGRGGDYTTREVIEDAVFTWNPTEGVNLDFGLLILPLARYFMQSNTSYINMDFHADSTFARIPNTSLLRDTGLQLRGFLFDRKIGYRVGAFNGNRFTTPGSPANTDHAGTPRLAGFFNVNLVGTEEGLGLGYVYQGLYFDKTVVSVGMGGAYQSGGTTGPAGVTDFKALSADVFADLALPGDTEFIFSASGFRFEAGRGNANTGYAGFVDIGYRWHKWQPYLSAEAFLGDQCATDSAGATVLPRNANTAEVRESSVGLNYWIERNRLHINTEYALLRTGSLTPPAGGSSQKHAQRFTLGASMLF